MYTNSAVHIGCREDTATRAAKSNCLPVGVSPRQHTIRCLRF